MSEDRDPKVSFRAPESMVDAVDSLADNHGVSKSALLRQFVSFGLETNAEALGVEAEISQLRGEIIDFGSPIDDAGGFPGRVRQDFEKRWKNGYAPKWLAAKAENYRREARMYEEKVPEHPDAPPIEEGELVEEVDRVLRETLEAAQLSDWSDRYSNPFEKYDGVESGRESRRFALVLAKNAMEMDDDLEPLRSTLSSERRVRSDDLPELADHDLPPNVDREDVARVARQLNDRGLDPEDVANDPTEFDPFGWTSEIAEHSSQSESEVAELPGPEELPEPADGGEPDGGVVADGGGDEAITSYAGEQTPADSGETTEDDESTENMDQSTPNPTADREEIINYVARLYEDMGGGQKARTMCLSTLTDSEHSDEHGYRQAVEVEDMDAEDIVSEAVKRAAVDSEGVEA